MINKSILIGVINDDPICKQGSNGFYSFFGVKTWYSKKKVDGSRETIYEFDNVRLFGKRAESFCSTAKKGDWVFVEGRKAKNEYNGKTSLVFYPDNIRKLTVTEVKKEFTNTNPYLNNNNNSTEDFNDCA